MHSLDSDRYVYGPAKEAEQDLSENCYGEFVIAGWCLLDQ